MLDVKNATAGCSVAEKGHGYCVSDRNAMLHVKYMEVRVIHVAPAKLERRTFD